MKFLLFLIFPIALFGQELNDRQEQKIDKFISEFFEGQAVERKAIDQKNRPNFDGLYRLYEIKYKGQTHYMYWGQAPSMKNIFDYALMLDSEWTILKAKVLIYREQHGRQIGATRWLRQFEGYSVQNYSELPNGVDGISGATISTTSMIKAVQSVLKGLST